MSRFQPSRLEFGGFRRGSRRAWAFWAISGERRKGEIPFEEPEALRKPRNKRGATKTAELESRGSPRLWMLLAACLPSVACSDIISGFKEGFEQEFKASFKTEFINSCTEEAGDSASMEAFCTCVATSLVDGKSATELTALTAKMSDAEFASKVIEETGCTPQMEQTDP